MAAVVAIAAWYFWGGGGHSASASAPAAAPPSVTVANPLQRRLVEWDEFTGQFAAVEFVEIRARVNGYLRTVQFADGQLVRKGDVLFQIDPRPYEVALATARAQLAEANGRLELANRQLARAGQLRDRGYTPGSTYDERFEEQRSATAAVESAKAAIRAAELDLEFSRITAPITGRVSRHEVSVGNLVAANTTLLTTIVALDPIHFVFDMSEADFLAYQRAVADGRLLPTRDGRVAAQVRLPDEKDWIREGRVDFVDNQVDRSAGTIRARAIFPNADFFITPGQFGRLRLPGSEPYDALLVPDSALVTDQSRKLLMVVGPDGTVSPRVVRPGPMELGLRIIRSGISPDDRVVINGLIRVRPGAKVTPQDGKIEIPEGRAG
jgi:RND family efflux transporter MFP subunit